MKKNTKEVKKIERTHGDIKHHYVVRYLAGETATELGLEIIEKGHSIRVSSFKSIVYEWSYQYFGDGLYSKSGFKTGTKTFKKRKYEDMTKEELIEHIKMTEEIENGITNKLNTNNDILFLLIAC